MGDWADAYLSGTKKLIFKTDYDVVASPGSDGVYNFLSDTFTLPVGAKNRAAAEKWLIECGSKAGQDAFNPKKGSIPARTDPDKSKYDKYLQYSIERFAQDTLVPSVVHGAAANERYMTAYGNALNVFSADRDKEALREALLDAAEELE